MPLVAKLAGHQPVHVVDRPGFGLSGDPGRVLDVIEHPDHLADWLNAAGLPFVAVLGNSFGCQVAVELAVRHPDRVAGLVLVGPTMALSARTAPREILRWLWDTVREDPLQLPILVRDVRDEGPRRVVGTLAHALRDPDRGQASPGQGAGAGHPGQQRTHRAAGLGADRHPTLVSPGLRRAARVRVGATGGAAELRQASCQRHRRLPVDASIRAVTFGYVAWMAVALVGLVAAGRCPTVKRASSRPHLPPGEVTPPHT